MTRNTPPWLRAKTSAELSSFVWIKILIVERRSTLVYIYKEACYPYGADGWHIKDSADDSDKVLRALIIHLFLSSFITQLSVITSTFQNHCSSRTEQVWWVNMCARFLLNLIDKFVEDSQKASDSKTRRRRRRGVLARLRRSSPAATEHSPLERSLSPLQVHEFLWYIHARRDF